jgi:hypothetical protein
MVDPPPFSMKYLKNMGLPSIYIRGIIISHCHADHDAGAFHKILEDTKIEVTYFLNFSLQKYIIQNSL